MCVSRLIEVTFIIFPQHRTQETQYMTWHFRLMLLWRNSSKANLPQRKWVWLFSHRLLHLHCIQCLHSLHFLGIKPTASTVWPTDSIWTLQILGLETAWALFVLCFIRIEQKRVPAGRPKLRYKISKIINSTETQHKCTQCTNNTSNPFPTLFALH